MHFDITLRQLFQNPPRRLMHRLFGATSFRVLDTDFPSTRQRTPDLIVLIGRKRLLHIELQSRHDREMATRMLEYRLLIRRRYPGHRIIQAVLYVGERPLRMSDGIDEPALSFRYQLIDLRSVDADFFLASDQMDEQLLAILGGTNDSHRVVEGLVDAVLHLPPSEARDRLVQVLVLSGLRGLRPAVEEEIARMPARVSVFDVPIIGKIAEDAMKRGEERGLEKGLEQGLERGREQGEHANAASTLTKLITKKFGRPPAWAQAKIEKASNRQLLAWSVALLDAPTLKHVIKP